MVVKPCGIVVFICVVLLRIAIEWRSKFRRIIMTIRIDMVAKFATNVTFS